MDFTIIKTIHGLIQLLCVVKSHGVHDADLIGFAFPKLNARGIAIKVKVKFNGVSMAFEALVEPLQCSEFPAELQSAIRKNQSVLTKCKWSTSEYCKRYLICLSLDEMKPFGANPIQHFCWNGMLFEADSKGKRCCFKKPRLLSHLLNIAKLGLLNPPVPHNLAPHVIKYG